MLSTERTGSHCESLTKLSYIELSFQAPTYDHNLLARVYTLTKNLLNPLEMKLLVQSTEFKKDSTIFRVIADEKDKIGGILFLS